MLPLDLLNKNYLRLKPVLLIVSSLVIFNSAHVTL